MGLIRAFLAVLALVAGPVPAPAQEVATTQGAVASSTEDGRLLAMLQSAARAQASLDPLGNLDRSEYRPADGLKRLFDDDLAAARRTGLRRQLGILAQIDRSRLSPERQLSYDAFLFQTREELGWLAPDILALTQVRPFNHFGGLHIDFPAMLVPGGSLSYETEADYRHALSLLRSFPVMMDRAIGRFRQGMDSGVVETRQTTANMIAQIDAAIASGPQGTPFAAPLSRLPDGIPLARQTAIRGEWVAAINQEIFPAYRRLRTFLAEEYLPAARPSIGLSAMKGGDGLYRKYIRRHTTLPLEPAAIHTLGLAEVARIQREMEQVKGKLGFSGGLPAFFDHIRTDPRFHPSSAEELGDGFAAVARRVDALLPRYFYRLPKAGLAIAPYPEYRGRFEAGGSYALGSPDGRRPGVFWFNTYDLPSRFTSGTATLYLHEGMPGHHLQAALAQENTALPDLQRFGNITAYVEGWALYAETLGFEMGLYDDPLQHWGTLDDEMLRAMRLVVDTGIHAKSWSRDQAIAYMLSNSGMGRSDAEAEVDRYIANPGQALAYKIGALTIQRLRREAETALGPRFDLRAFHGQVLDSGVLPLPVLEDKVRQWIATQQ
ncbi:MAG: DUF885 domain-containing protein [Novosphingobium sp.]|jgi:uncharacterized protein (DUF885 family)